MKKNIIITTIIALLCFTSCGTVSKNSLYSVSTRLEMGMQDLECLGECEVSCEYDTYLGFIRSINKVNGEPYNSGLKKQVSLPSQGKLKFPNKALNMASYKILELFPQAEYIQVVRETSDTDILFLGSTTVRTAKLRVYKFK